MLKVSRNCKPLPRSRKSPSEMSCSGGEGMSDVAVEFASPSAVGTSSANSTSVFSSLRVEISTADRGFRELKNQISTETEELWALALDPRKALIEKRMIFRGTVDSCLVHPRDIFRFGYLCNASSLIVAHSHPSGDLLPSEQDILFTQELIRAARFLQLPIVDHLIITPYGYSSFANEGWCRFSGK